jgi:hypothetical protein
MTDADTFADVRRALFQPERGLYLAPIRHHSPACAWAVRALIRDVKPKRVLIEAPIDFARHVDLLVHPETRPPVAIAALIESKGEHRVAAYYPFCVHAPEYVALHEAHAIGAEVRFIDLPAADKIMRHDVPDVDAGPIALNDEQAFDSGDFINALCRRLGCRDGYELWDHLFETRLGELDWQRLLGDVGAYCAGVRAATSAEMIERNGDSAREAHMGAQILDALQTGSVVAVIGGFHAPALIDIVASGAPTKTKPRQATSQSFLIRYGFAALDALNGYASGLPQPAYYDFLWRRANETSGEPPWRQTGLDLASGFAAAMREQDHPIGLPQQVEMLRVAEALALMRGRPGALRHDLIDAARTALVKGEAGSREVWSERLVAFLRGNAIGNVPASAGSPPLVEDARRLARRHRIDVSDGARRRRRLDIRRNAAHLAASRYFHAMTLLETGFAEREAGPDYLNNVMTDLLFEEWSYAWSPMVEGRLIELAARADRLDAACLGFIEAKREALRTGGQGRDIAAMAALFARGLLVGLGRELGPFLQALGGDIQAHADFTAVAATLRRLYFISRSAGPLGAPAELDLTAVSVATYQRLVYLCDDLPSTPPEGAGARVEALCLMMELLNEDDAGIFDRSLFDAATDRVTDAAPPPELLGAILAICVQNGRRSPELLGSALEGQFSGSVTQDKDRVAMLRGMLRAGPQLLWRCPGVLEVIDQFLGRLDEDAFLPMLPHLRHAFSALNPREIDQLAERLAQLHGGTPAAFSAIHHALGQRDLDRGLLIERTLRGSIAADGLGTWIASEEIR